MTCDAGDLERAALAVHDIIRESHLLEAQHRNAPPLWGGEAGMATAFDRTPTEQDDSLAWILNFVLCSPSSNL